VDEAKLFDCFLDDFAKKNKKKSLGEKGEKTLHITCSPSCPQ